MTTFSTKSVKSVKRQLSNITHIPISRQKLIYAGCILENSYSLQYYKIRSGSTLFLYASAVKKRIDKQTSKLTSKLIDLLNQLSDCDGKEFNLIVYEIKSILDHPLLIASARVFSDVQQLIDEATETLQEVEAPESREILMVQARQADQAMGFIDFNCELSSSSSGSSHPPMKTKVSLKNFIRTDPLPPLWESNSFLSDDEDEHQMRNRVPGVTPPKKKHSGCENEK